ncbi:MAG TPA: DUF1801 domain-containing protein [Candidatus Saccharimonadales bacterium]|nr:DUF1801 domain-containing protein [Candidatus Saccharimonadales bacterium]
MDSSSESTPASRQIDDIIQQYGGWKGQILGQIRAVIKHADPKIVEEVKWKTSSRPEGIPVWFHDGIICIAETWKDNVKLVFLKGAALKDPKGLFNARLMSRTDRAIEFHEHTVIDETNLKELILEAVRLNSLGKQN